MSEPPSIELQSGAVAGQRARPHVLLIPDTIHWVMGSIARQIQTYNPGFDFTICSEYALRKAFSRYESFGRCFDIAHVLTPTPTAELRELFPETTAIVSSLLHLEEGDWEEVPEFDAVMTIAEQWNGPLVKKGVPRSKIGMLPIATDPEMFRPPIGDERKAIRFELGLPQEAFVIGFSAKRSSDTSNRKGVDILTEAIALLAKQERKIALLIIGPGWQDFVETQRRNGIACVAHPYVIDESDVARFYHALDTFWVTSRIEGGPVPLLEAMASGVPSITTPVGVAEEIIDSGANGFLVGFDDAGAFRDHTLALAGDRALSERLGEAARSTIVEERSWAITAPWATQLYEIALREAGSRNQAIPAVLEPLPPRALSWIRAKEHLHFSSSLRRMGELEPSARLARLALKTYPVDPSHWWYAGLAELRRILRAGKSRT